MRHKITAIILCIVLVTAIFFVAPPARAITDGDSSIIRVKISIGSVTSFSVVLHGSYRAGDAALTSGSTYTAKVSGSSVKLYKGSSVVASGSTVYIGQTTRSDNTISLNNDLYGSRSYLGDMCFSVSSGKLLLVNHIDLEKYLYGVVPHEMSNSFPLEALKAQAVAARNYAVKTMGGSGSYDLTDLSSQDQVYKGYSASNTNAIAAVDATAGQIMKYGSTIIPAYYSASNGGWTELPYHRWGGGGDWKYYKIDYDPYDTYNPYDPASAGNRSSRYESILLPVAIDETHPITTSTNLDGTVNSGELVKYIEKKILDSGKLAGVSSVDDFTLTGVTDLYTHTYDTGSNQDHTRMPWNGVNDCQDKVGAKGSFTVSVGGTSTTVTDIDLDLRELKSDGGYPTFFAASLGLFVVEPVKEGETTTAFILSMKRYGHGLGLSQLGAQQRAKPVADGGGGQTYDQILQFYYPGTTLVTLKLKDPVNSVSGVTMNQTVATIGEGGTVTLSARVSPSTALEKTVTWSSSNEAVATVAGGVVTGVAVGEAIITATTVEGGYTAVCTVTVKLGVILSNQYTAVTDTITGVKKNTAITSFIGNLGNAAENLHVYTSSGAEVASGNVVTGMYVALYKDGAEVDRKTIIIPGDVNGDGNISISDYTLVRYDILSLKALTGVFKSAGDVNGDGKVSISDYTLIRYDILSLKNI